MAPGVSSMRAARSVVSGTCLPNFSLELFRSLCHAACDIRVSVGIGAALVQGDDRFAGLVDKLISDRAVLDVRPIRAVIGSDPFAVKMGQVKPHLIDVVIARLNQMVANVAVRARTIRESDVHPLNELSGPVKR